MATAALLLTMLVFPAQPPAQGIAGRVIDGDGEPVASATVEALDRNGKALAEAKTDAQGRFEVQAPGAVTLLVSKRGHASRRLRAAAGKETEVALHRAARISGQVRAPGRETVPAFKLEAWSRAGEVWKRGPAFAPKDPAGKFTLDLPQALYRLVARAEGLVGVSEDIIAEAGGTVAGVVLELRPTGTIRGRVARAWLDEPVAAAEVRYRSGERDRGPEIVVPAKTGPDGAFTLEGVPEGRGEVVVSHAGLARPGVERVTVRQSETAQVEVFLPGGTGVIHGTLTRGGKPVEGAGVTLALVSSSGAGAGRTDATDQRGRFRFSALPAGDYLLDRRRDPGASPGPLLWPPASPSPRGRPSSYASRRRKGSASGASSSRGSGLRRSGP